MLPSDPSKDQQDVTKVTLPVGIVVGIIGILAASWLIWCVLSGCQSGNASSKSATTATRTKVSFDSLMGVPAPPDAGWEQRLLDIDKVANAPLVRAPPNARLVPNVNVEILEATKKVAKGVQDLLNIETGSASARQLGGGKQGNAVPLIVIVILLLVVHARMTDRRHG